MKQSRTKIVTSLKVLVFAASFFLLLSGTQALADNIPVQPGPGITDGDLGIQYGAATGLTNQDPRLVVANILRVAMGLLGIIAIVIVLIAGFNWMTAGGNEEKISSAKSWLWAGVIGLIIILSAYSLATFIVGRLIEATQSGNGVNIRLGS